MKVAVLGLGAEGLKAVESLRRRGHRVYASDIRADIDLNLEGVDVDLGFHDTERIASSDAVVVSPSIFGTGLWESFSDRLLCRVLRGHRDPVTVAVTGTNGKTTTASMIAHVLESSGWRVLLGGNAGGGFDGYTEIILRAAEEEFDYIVVEVCDMTLEFASECFDIDLAVVTNLGEDHLNFHGSMENYRESMASFLEGRAVVISADEPHLEELTSGARSVMEYTPYRGELVLEGEFNRLNAGAAAEALKFLGVPSDVISRHLSVFRPVAGRIRSFSVNDALVVAGKTDNPHAMRALLRESNFDVIFLGTPRRSEEWRLGILDEIAESPPEILVLFPGLDDTIDMALEHLEDRGIPSEILTVHDPGDIPEMVREFSREYRRILVAGNGQDVIIRVQEELEGLASCL
ncbi:Mur ligase family protein [Methanothermobacter sp. EMTCatA1]|mgnify:FL=1|jgi:UDP-N-acetylmuramoylalanine--D-glutamate ligase|uniref:Mur ligase family protein n=1 Tax=Methanothermobacter TaxID=145260 RepID=UPI000B5FA905|nr:Mur ligase family protein [Methanothermobacter sp. EMTCatA1]MBC7112297.1 UDP-N-acetylmuramyl peptide synthase [Methanothermobacter sp.]MDK2875158.1 UDP-N-acetylmuramoylalanine--D-glutamate ligase [Methanothermobacter sp.]BAZ98579.1 UDP-N-acetylmuramoylalanine--D-glutamate ligase [Methanothermobacter sp. EMTCatA1]HIH71143.1 UDP-N-acetylmuramyl peptide synthase [Methanothermobacter thermautotrophicus]